MAQEEYLPIDEKTWEETGSKFAKPGEHVAVMGMPGWKTPNKSYDFPFTIEETGEDNGKEGHFYPGMAKFSLEPIFKACGVPFKFSNGKLVFDKMAFVGKKFISVWQEQVDMRPAEEGGKGGKYTKPVVAKPLEAKTADLF